jgi:hypothetical protein
VDLTGIEELILNEERRMWPSIYWDRLWEALKHNTTLKVLNTGFCYGYENINPIYDRHCVKLGEALKENNTLEILVLDWHEFTSVGVRSIAEGLKVNNKVNTLILSANDLDLSAFRALGELLNVNAALNTLVIDSIGLIEGDPEDFLVFCDALKTNTTLHKLHLSECELYEDSYAAFQEALKVNRGLKDVVQPDEAITKRRKKKQSKAEQEEARIIEEAGVKASDVNGKAEVLKSENEESKSLFTEPRTERSVRRAKATARANITPVMIKKTRKKREDKENGANDESKNSNENKIQEENEASKDNIKEPITKKAKNNKKNAVNKKDNLNKGFGIVRRKQRRAKLFAQSRIAPVMIRKTRKRKNNTENENSDENSKSEDKSTVDSPTRQQRKAKLIAGAKLTPLMLKKPRNKKKTLGEETNGKNNTKKKNNTNVKEEKLTKPKKYYKKKEINIDDINTPNKTKKMLIKVPPNQRRAKYFALANITPVMIRKTRKRRKTPEGENDGGDNEENNNNNNERKAKLVARKSITPLVTKKTRKIRKNDEESTKNTSPSKNIQDDKPKRGPGRPRKKRRAKSESTSGSSQEAKADKIADLQPKKQFKFVIPYRAKRKEPLQRKLN